MANIATMERLAEEAAAVFDPYKVGGAREVTRSRGLGRTGLGRTHTSHQPTHRSTSCLT
jgi:hypothetical protein